MHDNVRKHAGNMQENTQTMPKMQEAWKMQQKCMEHAGNTEKQSKMHEHTNMHEHGRSMQENAWKYARKYMNLQEHMQEHA